MSRWALDEDAEEVFDPAVGLGVFFRAARDIRPNVVLGGSEIDPVVLRHFRNSELPAHGSSVTNTDYLSAWGQKHQAIVCNPPYMRFQNFINRSEVSAQFESELDVRLSGYTNAASAFLLKSLAELNQQGRLAYIMPLEFLNAGYGTLVKTRLIEGGKLKALIRLEAEREIFPDAITSIGIVLVANDEIKDPVRFYTVASVAGLEGLLLSEPKASVPLSDLCPSEKWLKYFESQPDFVDHENLVSIREYGNFSRGIATGANEFFRLIRRICGWIEARGGRLVGGRGLCSNARNSCIQRLFGSRCRLSS
jgi:adenine-specific DNA-methyltransferase